MTELDELFAWACEEAELSEKTVPGRIHAFVRSRHKVGSGNKKPWHGRKPTVDAHLWKDRHGGVAAPTGYTQEASDAGILGAPPFAPEFIKYLQGAKPMTPIRLALRDMRSPTGYQWDGYIVAHAIVEGGYRSLPEIRAILKLPRQELFDEMALAALELLYTKAMEEERETRVRYGLEPRAVDMPRRTRHHSP